MKAIPACLMLFLSEQPDSLTSIGYNYGYSGITGPNRASGCCYLHNAVLFYNAQDEIFAFTELCFSCNGYRFSYKKTGDIAWCDSKFDLLKSFFAGNHIEIGIGRIPCFPMRNSLN